MNTLRLFRRALGRVWSWPRAVAAFILAPLLVLWLLCQIFGELPRGLADFPAPSYLAFIAPALAVAGALPFSIRSGVWVLDDRDDGVLEQLLAAPVPRVSLLLDELLAHGVGAVLIVPVVLVAARAAGMVQGASLVGALALLPIALAINALYAALSMAVAALFPRPRVVARIMGVLVCASVVLGDVALPAGLLPHWLLTLSGLNPLAHAIHAARIALTPRPAWMTYTRDLLALAGADLVCGAVALALHLRQPALALTPTPA